MPRIGSPVVVFGLLMGFVSSACGGDWPQILGPQRNGVAVGEQLLSEWPADGPAQVWSAAVGEGFAGAAIQGNTLVLFHRKGNQEVVEAFAADTGQSLWNTGFPCDYQSGLASDNGPRCVPLLTADRVYVFGVQGFLRCLDLKSGKQIWSRDTWTDFSAPEGYFGAGSSPVLFQDRLIVNVGGRENSAVVAFSAPDGATVWHTFNDTASYSSPVVASVDGQHHVIVVTRLNTLSLDPQDGRIRFQFPFGMRGATVNGATPVVIDDHVFVSASYRVGSVRAKLADGPAEPQSSGEQLLATQYATPVPYQGLLFAVDGRQDIGSATLKCFNPENQKMLWEQPDFHYGTLVRVDRDFLFLTCAGELIRFAANPDRYQEIQRVQVLQPTDRQYRLPAVSNGRLYIRDDTNLKCLQVGKSVN